MPFIFSVIIPLVILDIWIELYHRVGFWLYKIPYVERGKYVRIDRHRLSYLRWFEKAFCLYCGYANGLLPYAAAIAAETEKYWCAVMHKDDPSFQHPEHHKEFARYDDPDDLQTKYPRRTYAEMRQRRQ